MPNIGYLNGEFFPLEDMRVSVEDRGFQFGDGVYEVIRVYHGDPFLLEAHLVRLEQSAQAIQLQVPLSRQEWESRIFKAISLSGHSQCKVYIQMTRGVAPRDHQFSPSLSPTVVITVREMVDLDPILIERGVQVITLPDLRWGRCHIKSLNLLPNVLAKAQAKDVGAYEAIFVRDGTVIEGTSSNVMAVFSGEVVTPPLNENLLAGVTRQVVLDLARKEGIPVNERAIPVDALSHAQEIFLVGTTIEILPVTLLNGTPIGVGHPGEITKRLAQRFQELIA